MEKSVVMERVYVVPLRKAWNSAYHKRTRRAVRIIREFATRHMKSNVVKIDGDLNRFIWRRGNANPPRKIKVVMLKYDNGEVLVKRYGVKESEKEKKVPESKGTEKSIEKKEEVKKDEVKKEEKKAEEKENVKEEKVKGEEKEKGASSKKTSKSKTKKK